jgi:hypothetical protein
MMGGNDGANGFFYPVRVKGSVQISSPDGVFDGRLR